MNRSRLLTATVGLAASVLLSVVLWQVFDSPFVFLFVPLVPFLLRSRSGGEDHPPVQRCPACGFSTRDTGFDFCPRDGTRLESE